jgi:hypothetical protein
LVEQLPSFDAASYNRARAVASKVAELMVPPREAKAFEVSAICAIQSVGSGEVRIYCHNTEAQFEAIDGDNRFLKRFAAIGCG